MLICCALALILTVALAPRLGAQADAPALSLVVAPIRLVDQSVDADTARLRSALATDAGTPERLLAGALARTGGYAPIDQRRDASAGGFTACVPRQTAVACATQLGRTRSAERVAVATIVKVSSIIWIVTVFMVDVPGDTVRDGESIEVKGNIVDLLPGAMGAIARRLSARDRRFPSQAFSEMKVLGRGDVERLLAASTEQTPAKLAGANLSGADLSGLDFKRADLSRAHLGAANLARANLFGTSLERVDARGADFSGAVLDVAVMRGADLTGAILRGASLYATIAIDASFVDADLSNARIIAALGNAKLARAKLNNARLGADPANQPMGIMRTDLTGADLTEADLTGADLRKVLLIRANLTGADLTDADLSGADLSGAILLLIRGRDRLRGLDRARNVDKAFFTAP